MSAHPLCPAREDFCHNEACRFCVAIWAAVAAERVRCAAIARSYRCLIETHETLAETIAAEIERGGP